MPWRTELDLPSRPCRADEVRRGVAGIVIAIILPSCAAEPAIIDGSSAEAFASTTEAARDDLPIADRLQYDRAIATVPARRYGNRDPSAAARVAFDGMTAAQVVASERQRISGRI